MATIVLVHGAWSDASIWGDVIAALQDGGHQVLAVQLPLTSLSDDIAWTRRGIADLDGPITLVGHSYGGMVISGAACGEARIGALVFVAAYVPDESETVQALAARGGATPGSTAIRFAPDGWSTLDPTVFRAVLAADLPEVRAQVLVAVQKPTHGACFTSPSGPGVWKDLPCGYVVSRHDRIFAPGWQRWFAARASADVTEVDSSHLSPLARPAQVAAAVARTARAAASADTAAPGARDGRDGVRR